MVHKPDSLYLLAFGHIQTSEKYTIETKLYTLYKVRRRFHDIRFVI